MAAENDYVHDKLSRASGKPLIPAGDEADASLSGGMDCNICLDCVQDPVVTFCGHLYCWPCIYKWIHFQSAVSEDSHQVHIQCPVCKAKVSKETLIPLHGRVRNTKPSKRRAPQPGQVIPQRPHNPRHDTYHRSIATPSIGANLVPDIQNTSHVRRSPVHHQYSNPGCYGSEFSQGGGFTSTYVVYSLLEMFGDVVYARIFDNPETRMYVSPYSYDLAGGNSSRYRRHVMQADKSLSRVSFFLLCCLVLCLLVF